MSAAAGRFPGPGGHFLLGNLPDLRRDPLGFYTASWRRYGDLFRIRIGPVGLHVVTRPEHVEQVLVRNRDGYEKGVAFAKVRLLTGNGLFTVEDPPWATHRRLMQPPFTPRAIAGFASVVVETTDEMLARWRPLVERSQPLDLSAEMTRLTASVIGRTLLGVDLGDRMDETGRAFADALEFIQARTLSPIDPPLFLPTPANRRFKRAIGRLDALVYGLIAQRRADPEAHDDLLSILLRARDPETGQGMDERQLRDEVMTIFLAGHETTALALGWIYALLSSHPEAQRRLHQEVRDELGDRTPEMADLARLPYTRRVVDEALRLYPPAWAFPRGARRADRFGDLALPAGGIVLISPYLTHRHPEFWPEPERFDPDRFLPERAEGRPRYAYIPFGAGPRTCIGSHFALMEAQLVLARVAQRLRLELVGPPPAPFPTGTLRPREPLRAVALSR